MIARREDVDISIREKNIHLLLLCDRGCRLDASHCVWIDVRECRQIGLRRDDKAEPYSLAQRIILFGAIHKGHDTFYL